ncbi:MAG: hypothetical protein IJH32_10740 [Ruminococcus sp.]|nr:hypothetical protein [Ruminococcus sp.]
MISVSEITKRINQVIDDDSRKKLKATDITEWLLAEGLLKNVEANGKKYKLPTFDGTELGMTVERRENESGERYYVTLYNREAQAYLLDHLSFFEMK